MAALNEGVFTSKLFTFIVGEEKKVIAIHAEAIAKQSPALHSLINLDMKEAATGVTTFDDVLEDTFIRFCQFAYTGDYETPAFVQALKASSSPNISSRRSSTASDEAGLAVDPIDAPPVETRSSVAAEESGSSDLLRAFRAEASKKETFRNKRSSSKSRKLRREFDRKDYDTYEARSKTTDRCRVRENEDAGQDFTPIFLGHSRLYVFAEKRGVEALKTLTLHKLHRTLVTFTLYEARRRDVVELVKYAYSNDNTPDREEDVDALRALVTHYVTCELESLIEAPEFLVLLEQPGMFSRDLVKMMMRRIK